MDAKPVMVALVLCDHFYQDISGKSILAGTFTNFQSDIFPAVMANCGIYLACYNLQKGGKLTLVYQQEGRDQTEELSTWNINEAPKDPTDIFESGVQAAGLPIDRPGKHEFLVLWNGQAIGRRHFFAKILNQKLEVK
jgi:hypothetical protein